MLVTDYQIFRKMVVLREKKEKFNHAHARLRNVISEHLVS